MLFRSLLAAKKTLMSPSMKVWMRKYSTGRGCRRGDSRGSRGACPWMRAKGLWRGGFSGGAPRHADSGTPVGRRRWHLFTDTQPRPTPCGVIGLHGNSVPLFHLKNPATLPWHRGVPDQRNTRDAPMAGKLVDGFRRIFSATVQHLSGRWDRGLVKVTGV